MKPHLNYLSNFFRIRLALTMTGALCKSGQPGLSLVGVVDGIVFSSPQGRVIVGIGRRVV
jgi:hypothetical protein